jgi:RNA polymerase sigma factor (sigma-70 family)
MPEVKDVRVEVRVKNNLLLRAMEARGINSISELCRQMGESTLMTRIGLLINMKKAARHTDGSWDGVAIKLSDFFRCMPEDLFSEPQQYEALEKNRAHAEVTFAHMLQISAQRQLATPELTVQARQLREVVAQTLATLTPREERIVRLRFGFGGEDQTLEEVATEFGVGPQRIRQIEVKALRKLKHPARSTKLLEVAGVERAKDEPFFLDDEVLDALLSP